MLCYKYIRNTVNATKSNYIPESSTTVGSKSVGFMFLKAYEDNYEKRNVNNINSLFFINCQIQNIFDLKRTQAVIEFGQNQEE